MVNTAILNDIYQPLEEKQASIVRALKDIDNVRSGWYNGHYNRDDSGKWIRDSFPIPEVNIMGMCDIEISFDKITVTTKLKRNEALEYDYTKLAAYEFEVYGVNDYLRDFYRDGMTAQELKTNILHSSEEDIGFSFIFPFETDVADIAEFTRLLKREEFFY